jgi:hypothetical protein
LVARFSPGGTDFSAAADSPETAGAGFTAAAVPVAAELLSAGASVAVPHDMHFTAPTTLRKSQFGQTTPRFCLSKATIEAGIVNRFQRLRKGDASRRH